jgi:hypothetical protein
MRRTYLNSHHLQLKHLHLNVGLRSHIGGKTWTEGDAIGIHALVMRETIDGTIDSGSGHIAILEYLSEVVSLLRGVRRKTTEIERASRRRSFKGG